MEEPVQEPVQETVQEPDQEQQNELISRGNIYLLRVYPNHPVLLYKLGRTNNFNRRLTEYIMSGCEPEVLLVKKCYDDKIVEKDLLRIFKNTFLRKRDTGKEYFGGDVEQMKQIINNYFETVHIPKYGEYIEPINIKMEDPASILRVKTQRFLTHEDGLNEFEKNLLQNTKLLEKHANLMMFLDHNYDSSSAYTIIVNLFSETVKMKHKKLKLVIGLMKDLKLETFDKFDITVIERFVLPFETSEWLSNNLPLIKHVYDIRGKKYDIISFYSMYQLLNTLLDNMFGSELFESYKKQIKRIDYKYYIYNREVFERHIIANNKFNQIIQTMV